MGAVDGGRDSGCGDGLGRVVALLEQAMTRRWEIPFGVAILAALLVELIVLFSIAEAWR